MVNNRFSSEALMLKPLNFEDTIIKQDAQKAAFVTRKF
jgi:hypothetical protein